jgi:eukaryotic-like serine/threonine-protein kinase
MKSFLQKIGDYQILEKLGRGGMADVYLAMNLKNNLRIALKLVEAGSGEEAREIVDAERLGAELQRSLSLVDSRVPGIYACGELEGYLFIEMEFVEGSDLSTLIASKALKTNDAARIGLELCGILRNAHAMSLQISGREFRGIVHGDIKPKNIRIDPAGKVRVLDFGIAKGLSVTRRLTSNVFGSVAYSSPERLDTGRIDEMSDLWSLGMVLYEMVEGRLPYEAANTEGLEAIVRSYAAPRPLREECPIALQQIIYKALSRSPSFRYQNAQSFESDIESFLSGGATLASRENEETRRTAPMEGIEGEETRRTPGKSVPAANAILSMPILRKLHRYFTGARKWALTGGIVLLAIVGIWEVMADRAAFKLKSEIMEGRLNADNSWDRYQKIRRISPLGFGAIVMRSPLRNLLRESCDRVCSDYRNSDGTRII